MIIKSIMSISFVNKETFSKCWDKFIKGTWNANDEYNSVYGSFIKTHINKNDFKSKFGSFKVSKIMVAEVLPLGDKAFYEYLEPNEHLKWSDEIKAARIIRMLNSDSSDIIWGDAIVQVYKNWSGPITPLEDIKFNGESYL
tara:strand:- start:6211 stop:6633 length:423 start_codon:yes stop_codon:yes gene_type:complete